MSFLVILGKVGTVIATAIGGLFGIIMILTSFKRSVELKRVPALARVLNFILGFLLLAFVAWLFSIVF